MSAAHAILAAMETRTGWRKPGACTGTANCVEVAWQRSADCGDSVNCVEVAGDGGNVLVRDGKLGDGSPVLSFNPGEWAAFCAGVRSGEFDLPELAR